jgi:hypothetical protein
MPREVTRRQRIAQALARLIAGPAGLATVTSQVDDSPGWLAFTGGPNERDHAEIQELYKDTLEAWRKNPMAKRIIDTTTDFALGDGLIPTAPGRMGTFLTTWWTHPKNHMPLRMPDLSDELGRAGDLFVTLHRNEHDGLSYVRPIPKDRIIKIETLPNDWETEIAYLEARDAGEPRRWISPAHPAAEDAPAVMIHYAVNRAVGCLMGESDLSTLVPWLLRYSRMLEDRVRLHWALRSFLWMVTVPANKVPAKREQYRKPPSGGSVIVKDDSETWEAVTPTLRGADAGHDMKAVRQMIDAGSGFPPHWRGEGEDVNLATAKEMRNPAQRHLRRRQLYLRSMVQDLAHTAYTRAHALGRTNWPRPDRERINVDTPDIARDDNQSLAEATYNLSRAMHHLQATLPGRSTRLTREAIALALSFAGKPPDEETLDTILQEIADNPVEPLGPASDVDDNGRGPKDDLSAAVREALESLAPLWTESEETEP